MTGTQIDLGDRLTGHLLDNDTWHLARPVRIVRGTVVAVYPAARNVATVQLRDGSKVTVRRVAR